ncbi:MAG: MBOAT family protein, partial [Lachnospiraceae bacterium]|nr:MBOAT family protein [Lachnospiraceae bacterium]
MVGNLRKNRITDIVLLIICWIFYSMFDIRGLFILIAVSLFTYMGGKFITGSRQAGDTKKAGMFCGLLVAFLIGMLCYFKYSPEVALPVGMSFYMLMAISFLADCLKGSFDEYPPVLDVCIYISFFPTILSGPITKAKDFIPQVQNRNSLTKERFTKGLWLIAIGLFMKLCMADRLSVSVDKVYATPLVYSGLTLFFNSIGYSLQLLFDFAGYSNMAAGAATLLGFDIPVNFNLPYMATNPSEFWNRWHISLSSWLKEYVYIPLGGNRKGERRTYINILLVMIISGLWHGSTVNFLIWGIFHGIGQMVHRAVCGKRKDAKSSPAVRILSMILNFLFVNFLWIPFRVNTLSDTRTVISRIFTLADGADYYYVYTFIFGIMLLIVQFIGSRYNNGNSPVKPLPFDRLYARV